MRDGVNYVRTAYDSSFFFFFFWKDNIVIVTGMKKDD